MTKSLILLPRLDTSFKKIDSYIPQKNYDNLPLIRQYWKTFGENLCNVLHSVFKHEIEILEQPLWQFEAHTIDDYAKKKKFDYVFVPHKEPHNFPIQNSKPVYYMQTVFPFYFTLDSNGWGSNLSFIDDISLSNFETDTANSELFTVRERFFKGVSKFDQPSSKKSFENQGHWLFICQLPHDETIRFHSDVGVLDAIKAVHRESIKAGVNLHVKGHPINKDSMREIQEYCNSSEKRNIKYYCDEISILDSISAADKIFLVNSGAGFECLLINAELYHFGKSEYRNVSKKLNLNFTLDDLKSSYTFNQRDFFLGNFLTRSIQIDSLEHFERNLKNILT